MALEAEVTLDDEVTREAVELHTRVMVNLGVAGSALARWEKLIQEALDITDARAKIAPGNPANEVVRRLLLAGQEFVAAHKAMVDFGESAMRGGIHTGTETIQ